MSGYDVILVNRRDCHPVLYCSHCRLLLRDPVQVIAGELEGNLYCKACIPETVMDYRRDKAVEKEVMKLQVYCSNTGCYWQGCLASYLQHQGSCEPRTKKAIMLEKLQLKEEIAKLQGERWTPQTPCLPFLSQLEGESETQLNMPLAENMKMPTAKDKSSKDSESSDFEKLFVESQETASALTKKTKQNKLNMDCDKVELQQHAQIVDAYTRRLSILGRDVDFSKDIRRKIYDVSDEEFTVFNNEKPLNGSSMQCRLIITNVAQKTLYACNYSNEPLTTPPWSISCDGYKMKAHVYLNGYGDSLGKYISVSMSVVCGPHDDFLQWPVHGTVTFCLLDHKKNIRPIIRTFHTNPKYPFQRPTPLIESDMNAASGCPEFAPIHTLKQERYVKDNTMVWEFSFVPSKKIIIDH